MKTLNKIITGVLMMAGFASSSGAVYAATGPSIDQLNVQGYMKKANGTAITDGTFNIAFGVFQNGSPLWCGIQAVTTLNGLFSVTLTGVGSDCSTIPAGTAMNQNYSAGGLNKTLNPALLSAATTGEVSVVVYSIDPINAANPQFTLNIGAVPTAFVADTAKTVVAGSITYASVAAGSKTLVSTGAANIFPVTDATGKLDLSVIPTIPLSTNVSGITPIANGGTGQSSATAALSALGGAARGSNTDITSLTGLTTALSVAQGGSNNAALAVTNGGVVYTDGSKLMNSGAGVAGRVLLSGGAGAPTWGFPALSSLGAAASGANTDITSLAGLTTVLSLGQGGTGGNSATTARTALSAAVLGANNDITAITGLTTALALTQGGTGNLTLANAAGGVLYTDGTIVQNTGAGAAGNVLVSAGAAVPVWGALGGIGAAARGSNTDISSLGFPGNLQITNTGTFKLTNSGFLTLNPTGALTLGGASTTRINLGTSVYNMTLPNAQGALNSILTNDGAGNLSWASVTTNGAAARGTNTDITSLTGLTTALSVAQGGTNNIALAVTNGGVVYTDGSKLMNSGAGGAGQVLLSGGAGAPTWGFPTLNSLGAAARGANTDITSLAGLTTALSLGQGGTGGNTAATARTALSAAVLGANNDITAITGLTTALALTQGGTGNLTLANAAGGVLYTDGTVVQNTGVGVAGKVLVSAGAGVPVWGTPTLGSLGAAARGSNTDISSLGFPGNLQITNTGTFNLANSGFLTLNPTGALTLGGTSTTRINLGTSVYNMTLPNAQGALNSILTNDGAGNLSWASVTTNGAAARGSNTDLTSLNPTANLTIGDAATTGLSLIPNGNINLAPVGGRTIGIGGAGSSGITLNPAGNVAISPTSGGVTINPVGALILGNSNTTGVSIQPSSGNAGIVMSAAGTGNLTIGSATGTGSVLLGNSGAGSVTSILSGTGNLTIGGANVLTLPSTSFLITQGPATTGDLSITTTNNANMVLAPNGSGGLTLGSAAGTGTTILGNAGGAAMTLIRSGTGNLTIAGANALTLPATSFLITQAAGATGDLSITTTTNNNVSIVPNGTGVLSVNGFVEWSGQSRATVASISTSTVVLSAITGLSATLQAGKTYAFDIQLYTTSNVAGGIQVDLAGGTATAANIIGDAFSFDAGAIKTQNRISALNTVTCAFTGVTVANCHITGTITTTAGGTFIPRFAQNASNAAASTVAIGSTMILQQIN